jgi:DNA-binding SARP family transcriptional activator
LSGRPRRDPVRPKGRSGPHGRIQPKLPLKPKEFPSPPELELRLLGRFAVLVDGENLAERPWERRSARSLIKLLALAPSNALHREQVLDQLWPDVAPETAANSLNKSIHAARRALEPGLTKGSLSRYVLTPGSQVVLASPGTLRVDVHAFERTANAAIRDRDIGEARRAVQMYTGELLVDDLYETWTVARRDLLRLLFRTLSIRVVQWLLERSEPEPGLEIAQRLIQDDPLDEQAHRLLIQLHAASGQRELAKRQFEVARSVMLNAGIDLGPEILELAQTLRAHRSRADGARADESVTATAGSGWSPHIEPLTFQPGRIRTVRSAPDGDGVWLTADWDGPGFGLYRLRPGSLEVERQPWQDVELFAVSSRADLALGLNPIQRNSMMWLCTLCLAPATGEPQRHIADGVQYADWHPRAAHARPEELLQWLAVVREVEGVVSLEFPIGTVRCRPAGWISHPRFSPDGRYIAFLDHTIDHDDAGNLILIDLQAPKGESRLLVGGYQSARGLAWLDQQVWVTASQTGQSRSLQRLTLDGQATLMHRGNDNLQLHDAGPGRRLLISADKQSVGTRVRHANDDAERDISWHEYTTPRDIFADGRTLLIEEENSAGWHHFTAYLRSIDGASTRQLAKGVPLVLSPDQRTVVMRQPGLRSSLRVLDISTRRMKTLDNDDAHPLVHNEFVSFFPDGQRIAFSATDAAGTLRIYLQQLAGGKPVCFTPDVAGMRMPCNRGVSPDGRWIVLTSPDECFWLYPTEGGDRRPLIGLGAGWRLITWHRGGESLFVYQHDVAETVVYRYLLSTGGMVEWLRPNPDRLQGVSLVRRLRMTDDGRSYAYAFARQASDLYLFDDS